MEPGWWTGRVNDDMTLLAAYGALDSAAVSDALDGLVVSTPERQA